MAGGFLGLGNSLLFPNETQALAERNKGGGSANPLFAALLGQLQTSLNPQTARRRTRRQFSHFGDQLARGYEGANQQFNQNLAQRGLQGAGFAAPAQAAIGQQYAQARGQLPGLYQQALDQRQQQARNEAANFLAQTIQERLSTRGQSDQIAEARRNRPTGFQSVLGDIQGITDVLGGSTDSQGNSTGGIASLLPLLALL